MGTAFNPAKTSPASWDSFSDVDAFVDAPDGLYVPLPKKTADDGKGAVTPCSSKRS